jgi:hypothetical protein
MNKDTFLEDIQILYNFITNQKMHINILYRYLETHQYSKLTIINEFAKNLNLNLDDDLRVALVIRLVSLRDDSLNQVLKKLSKNDEEIENIKEKAYIFVKNYWIEKHKEILDFIYTNKLLTPFYRAIFKGVYEVGIEFSNWQTLWTKLIINGVNKDLLKEFNDDDVKVMNYLKKNNLFDIGHSNQISERSYSMLIKKNNQYRSYAYIKAFKKDVIKVVSSLEKFAETLIELEDEVYSNKEEYILFIQSIIKALLEDKTNTLILRWADVDRAWMKIKTPIQIGYPLEYYEDHFRKAVALEWDIRLTSPTLQNNNNRVKKIKYMFETIYSRIDKKQIKKSIYGFSLKSLDKVQLYLGRPALFFASQFNGLFSAQVVPNDEIVSREEGKKIFAFSDEILQTQQAKPFLKLSTIILGQSFLTEDRKFLFDNKNKQKWHQVYDITTIGHEYGHILWCDETTETIMNQSGNFKNIEEFKATAGGLVSFFIDKTNSEISCQKQVLTDTIKRAIGLIGWMEVDEVQPYYCEGLIHLSGLFTSKVLGWNDNAKQLNIDLDNTTIQILKNWYIKTYSDLANHYLEKKDATIWLNKYVIKKNGNFLPKDINIKIFVEYYFTKYKSIGQELELNDKKSNYKI